ncbi:MAG: hypothetical protein ABSB01_16300 [Streptosporangiaceae bacterium]|jgi:hypothetical protein
MNRLTVRNRDLQAAGAALIISLALGACSSSGSTSSDPGSSPTTPTSASPTGQTMPPSDSAGVVFHGKVQLTGASKFTATFTEKDTAVKSCADVAAKGDAPGGTFTVPSPYVTQNPLINVKLARFHGAGTYPPTEMQSDTSDSIWLKTSGATSDYEITSHPATSIPGQTAGKEVLFLEKDGSGELAFSEAHKLGQKSSPAIDGLISWTCST